MVLVLARLAILWTIVFRGDFAVEINSGFDGVDRRPTGRQGSQHHGLVQVDCQRERGPALRPHCGVSRRGNAVGGRGDHVVGDPLQVVAGVENDRPWRCHHSHPLHGGPVQHLQAFDRARWQQREEVDVLVPQHPTCTGCECVGRQRWVEVETEPKVRVGEVRIEHPRVLFSEVVQDAPHDRPHERLLGLDNPPEERLVCRGRLGPERCQPCVARTPFREPKRSPAKDPPFHLVGVELRCFLQPKVSLVHTPLARRPKRALHVGRGLQEEGFDRSVGLVQQSLRDAVPCEHCEPNRLQRGAEHTRHRGDLIAVVGVRQQPGEIDGFKRKRVVKAVGFVGLFGEVVRDLGDLFKVTKVLVRPENPARLAHPRRQRTPCLGLTLVPGIDTGHPTLTHSAPSTDVSPCMQCTTHTAPRTVSRPCCVWVSHSLCLPGTRVRGSCRSSRTSHVGTRPQIHAHCESINIKNLLTRRQLSFLGRKLRGPPTASALRAILARLTPVEGTVKVSSHGGKEMPSCTHAHETQRARTEEYMAAFGPCPEDVDFTMDRNTESHRESIFRWCNYDTFGELMEAAQDKAEWTAAVKKAHPSRRLT
eukprot:m.232832 g.232832  ORF g.232832 m.232832 type:complete len:591 (-) comp26073_c0_seq1:77-1849(-)